jgi:amino acid adenylation domain-containing protein
VAKSPEAVAVVFEDQQLTYAQLNAKANQLAHHLRSLGVKPDTLVAICVERSLEMVIGLLGILKAGGAYVPLDPDYPAERLVYMLQDTAAPVLLTQGRLKERLPAHQARTVCLDEDWEAIGKIESTNPVNHTHPLNLAYCIYTSGSTGKPKGVQVTTQAVLNLIGSWNADHATRPTERTSLWTSLGFDVSIWEWMLPICSGAGLAIPTDQVRLDPFQFLRWTGEVGVTTAYLPPHIARLLPDLIGKCVSVPSRVLLGVEPLNERSLAAALGETTVLNGYGPTEATVYASAYAGPLQPLDRNIPIGRPIANTQIYLLDGDLNPVPAGVAGEIHIAGAGLARGYLNRPELTAEKFIANPYGEPGSRMYRTGDLGRYLSDGNIEFLGRIDHQVKIRGFRIELGEIENALLGHPQVREAVVLAREDDLGDKRLVAYVVGKAAAQPPSLTVSELRSHLGQTLPEYMVPSGWVFLDALPLNPNGKIDRKALQLGQPVAHAQNSGDRAIKRESSGDKDADLLRVLTVLDELLPGAELGPDDDLFEKGLHSLLMLRFAARCRSEFHTEVKVSEVFRLATARSISKALQARPE